MNSTNPTLVFVKARAATTKNGKETVLPLVPGLAAVMRLAHPLSCEPKGRVFAALPRMERVSPDFAKAGIPRIDASGRHADFHSLRHTFCTRLAVKGISLQVAMVLTRHSDPKLTTKVYTAPVCSQLPRPSSVYLISFPPSNMTHLRSHLILSQRVQSRKRHAGRL